MLNLKPDILEYQQSSATSTSEPLTSTSWCLQRVIQLESFYPQLSKIADILLSMPVSNAWPERGASALKRVKTRLRSSIKNDMLQALMQVSINGPSPGSEKGKFLVKTAVGNWVKRKNRRKLPKKVGACQSKESQQRELSCSDASVQTDPYPGLTRDDLADLVRDEVRAYSKAVQLPLESPQPSDDSDSESDDNNSFF